MNTKRILGMSLFAVAALASACGGGSASSDAGPTSTSGAPAPEPKDAGAEADGSRPNRWGPDAGAGEGVVDSDDTLETAVELILEGSGNAATIDPPGDLDHYRFLGEAGTFVKVIVRSNGNGTPQRIDPVLTLLDEAGNEIAEIDDASRTNVNPELTYRIPVSGVYFLRVEDITTWQNQDRPRGGPGFAYNVRIQGVDDGDKATALDAERGDDLASAQAFELDGNQGAVYGTFRDQGDLDVYAVTVEAPSILNLSFKDTVLMGSTGSIGRVWVQNEAGVLWARMDRTIGQIAMSPSLPAGTSYVFVSHTATTAGANSFYAFDVAIYGENSPETGEPANDAPAGAEALTQARQDDGRRRAFFLATLEDGDVDYFSFNIQPAETLVVSCSAQAVGSGIRGLTGEVLDASLTRTASAADAPLRSLYIEATPTSTGTHYLKLSKVGQDPEVQGNWVRCAVSANPAPANPAP